MRVLAVLALAACGRVGFDPGGSSSGNDAPGIDASPDVAANGVWTAPILIASLASASDDWGPALDPSTTRLVFHSDRGASDDLYMSTFQTGWSAPILIAALATGAKETDAAWNGSGTRLYFSSDRSGSTRLYECSFDGTSFGPPSLVAGMETTFASAPTLSADELEMFYTTGNATIARTTRASTAAPWTPGTEVAELSSATRDGFPTLSRDGLTIYFETDRDGTSHIYRATRPAVGAPFGGVMPVIELQSDGSESDPELSADDRMFLFGTNRTGGSGKNDIYITTR